MEEKIREYIESLTNEEKRSLWNEYCNADNRTDDWIYNMSEFDDINEGRMPSDIALSICYGDFRAIDDYFWFNGYANFESSNWIDDDSSPFYINELISYIIENDNDLYDDNIREILEGEEEEE